MFDLFRNHTKILMGILVLLIIPSFVLFGIDGYTQFAAGDKAVAEVNGDKVTQAEWDMANERAIARIREQNPNAELADLDTPELKYATLEQLVRERVLRVAAQKSHLVIGNTQLAAALSKDPTIASMRDASGKLDMDMYKEVLARQGMSPESFEANVRRDLSGQQVILGLVQSGFASSAQAGVSLDALRQQRNIQYFLVNASEYAANVKPDDAELQAYYKKHEDKFKQPETADIEYVELTLDAIKSGLTVPEDDLKTYYEANKGSLGEAEQRKASHILIEAPKDMPAEERAKLRAKADAIHAEVTQNPASFADVAKRESQDTLTAPKGGDLGFFAAMGAAVVDEISKAAFALKDKGNISPVIDADFGFDIVQLTDITPSKAPPFEVVRAKLDDQYRSDQAQKTFSSQAEEMGKLAFENRGSLKAIADAFKLPTKTANGYANARQQPASVPAALSNGELVAAVFTADVTSNQGNTQPVALTPTQIVVARVVKHVPAHTQSFEQVTAQVRQMYVADESAKLAMTAANEKLEALRKAPESGKWLPAVDVSRDIPGTVPAPVVEAAMKIDLQKKPALQVVNMGEQGAAMLLVNKIVPAEALPAEIQDLVDQQFVNTWSTAEADAYYSMLKDRFKVKILAPKPNK